MGSIISSFDIAVLTKVNELAERYGLEAWEFEAEYDTQSGALSYTSTPAGEEKYNRFLKMTEALGCENGRFPSDSSSELIHALTDAIRMAPRARVI